jgi:hypothetical protein
MVIGQVAIFRSVPRSVWDGCKIAYLCRFHGPWDGGTDRNVGIGARSDLARAISLPGLLEIDPTVALALRPDLGPHVDRDDAEGAQEASKLALGDGLAPIVFRPRPLGIGDELRHEVDRADNLVAAKGLTAMGKQRDAHCVIRALARERKACLTRQLRPLAASEVGDGEEGPPVVSRAVVERLRHLRIGIDELVEVVHRPARGLAAQSRTPFVVALAQPLDLCPRRLAL